MLLVSSLCLLSALSVPAPAQVAGLEPGFYVIDQYKCDDAPAVGVMSFDGKAFINHGVSCTLPAEVDASGRYAAKCAEKGDSANPETISWKFKVVSARSFQINKNVYRQCSKTP